MTFSRSATSSSDYQLKHVANHEARVVKHNLLQDWDDTDALMPSNHRYVPSAVFTDPQIASVGLTENEARAKGYSIKVKIQDFADVAYGWAMEDTTGIAKIVVDDESGLILGAHIMGHQASSLIQPLIQAMAFDLPAQDMARGQYWIHPALPEVIENALLALCGEPPWPPSRAPLTFLAEAKSGAGDGETPWQLEAVRGKQVPHPTGSPRSRRRRRRHRRPSPPHGRTTARRTADRG